MCKCECSEKMSKKEFRAFLIQVLRDEVAEDREGNSYYKFTSDLYDAFRQLFNRMMGGA